MNQSFCVRKSLLHDRMIRQMIEMSVREPKADQLPAAALDFMQKWCDGVIRRVEEHRLIRGFIGYDEAIGGGNSAGVHQNLHASHFITTKARKISQAAKISRHE